MARSVRIEYAGPYYHVMARGNRREAIFFDDDDRRFFLQVLAGRAGRRGGKFMRGRSWAMSAKPCAGSLGRNSKKTVPRVLELFPSGESLTRRLPHLSIFDYRPLVSRNPRLPRSSLRSARWNIHRNLKGLRERTLAPYPSTKFFQNSATGSDILTCEESW